MAEVNAETSVFVKSTLEITTGTLYRASVTRLIEAVLMKICKIKELYHDYGDFLFSILLVALSAIDKRINTK